jgi:hypothetical protein
VAPDGALRQDRLTDQPTDRPTIGCNVTLTFVWLDGCDTEAKNVRTLGGETVTSWQ